MKHLIRVILLLFCQKIHAQTEAEIAAAPCLVIERNGYPDSCLRCLANLSEKSPLNFELHCIYGLALFRSGREKQAAEELYLGSFNREANTEVRLTLAMLRIHLTADHESFRLIDSFFRLYPGKPDIMLAKADALFYSGKYTESIELGRQYIKKVPSDAYAFFLLGLSNMKLGAPAEAMFYFNRCTELESAFVRAYLKKAEIYLDRRYYAEVFRNLDKAQYARNGFEFEIKKLYSKLYYKMGEYDLCISETKKALSLQKDETLSFYLCDAYLETGNYSKAAENLESVGPYRRNYLIMREKFLKKDCSGLNSELQKLMMQYPEQIELTFFSAACRNRSDLNSVQKSLNEIDTLLRKDSFTGEYHLLRAELLQAKRNLGQKTEDPCISYQKAISLKELLRSRKVALSCIK